MMLFWIITAAMILAALAMLAPSLLRKQGADALDRDQQNVVIARERLAELQAERAQGRLSDAQFDKARAELEQALLRDLDQPGSEGSSAAATTSAGRLAMAATVLLVPALTLGLYSYLGSPQLVDPGAAPVAHNEAAEGGMASVEEMMRALVKRLQENPGDTEGWFLLGRSYMAIKDYSRAAQTFEQLHKLVGDDPAVLLSWADAQAMAQSGNISGKPAELVKKAIKLVPEDTTALWLAGIVAEQEGDYQQALEYWGRLQPKLAGDDASQQRVAQLIADARQKAGLADEQPAAESATLTTAVADMAAPATPAVRLRISMAPAMAAKAQPGDSLFIYAKALQGPPMPLAAARMRVSDLPLEITLDDSQAMMPEMRISNFEQVTVGARVSKSGNPAASSGDLAGEVSPVSVQGAGLVEVLIDSQLP